MLAVEVFYDGKETGYKLYHIIKLYGYSSCVSFFCLPSHENNKNLLINLKMH